MNIKTKIKAITVVALKGFHIMIIKIKIKKIIQINLEILILIQYQILQVE